LCVANWPTLGRESPPGNAQLRRVGGYVHNLAELCEMTQQLVPDITGCTRFYPLPPEAYHLPQIAAEHGLLVLREPLTASKLLSIVNKED